jgi:hypothetical protein
MKQRDSESHCHTFLPLPHVHLIAIEEPQSQDCEYKRTDSREFTILGCGV